MIIGRYYRLFCAQNPILIYLCVGFPAQELLQSSHSNSPLNSKRQCAENANKQGTKDSLTPWKPSARKLACFPSRAFALIRQIPASSSSSRKRRPWLSSALVYKFIRKLSQFKCPRCFNQGASPSAPHARINNSRINFPSFRLSSALFAPTPPTSPFLLS